MKIIKVKNPTGIVTLETPQGELNLSYSYSEDIYKDLLTDPLGENDEEVYNKLSEEEIESIDELLSNFLEQTY